MAMLKPSQSHSGGVIVNPYTGNIAQELQFLTGETKTNPILNLGSPWQLFARADLKLLLKYDKRPQRKLTV